MITNSPLISVIVPTYNSALFVERCLDSVINQSIKNIEIIVVDDLSTDQTINIIKSYADICNKIKIFESKKKGMAGGARNIGIENSNGKYISFIDSDDWIDTDFYYHMVNIIERDNVDIAVCGVKREYENAKSSSVRYNYNTKNTIDGKYALTLLSNVIDQDVSISAIVCNKLFKASLIKDHMRRFIDNCYNEDDVFMFDIFLDAQKVGITNNTNYHQYQRRNSVSRSFTKKHIDDLFFAFKTIRGLLLKRNVFEEYRAHYYSFFEKCLGYMFESLRLSEQDNEAINAYLKYAYSASKDSIPFNEFIDHCGNKRIELFFLGNK